MNGMETQDINQLDPHGTITRMAELKCRAVGGSSSHDLQVTTALAFPPFPPPTTNFRACRGRAIRPRQPRIQPLPFLSTSYELARILQCVVDWEKTAFLSCQKCGCHRRDRVSIVSVSLLTADLALSHIFRPDWSHGYYPREEVASSRYKREGGSR